MLAVEFRDVIHAADIRMRQLPRDANLGKEPFAPHRIVRQCFGKKLKSDGLAEFQIIGAIDFPHPAASHEPDDAIPVCENRARREPSDRN
jgi:hypothetical protein